MGDLVAAALQQQDEREERRRAAEVAVEMETAKRAVVSAAEDDAAVERARDSAAERVRAAERYRAYLADRDARRAGYSNPTTKSPEEQLAQLSAVPDPPGPPRRPLPAARQLRALEAKVRALATEVREARTRVAADLAAARKELKWRRHENKAQAARLAQIRENGRVDARKAKAEEKIAGRAVPGDSGGIPGGES